MNTMTDFSGEQQFTAHGCTIHYWIAGSPNRPLVIFTHGAGIDHREWESAEHAIAAQYRVVTWDVRGHGRSRPNTLPFTVPLATDDLIALMDHLHAESAILVGHSMGGNIVQEVIRRSPARVQAAVLLGCANNVGRLTTFERLEIGASGPLFALYPYTVLRRQSANISAAHTDVRTYIYEAMGLLTKAEFVQVLRALLQCLHEAPGYHIPVPFLLTHGADDKTGNIRRATPGWARGEPNGTYIVVPDAGHVANMDNPSFFNQILLRFLRQQAP